jgi:hypothetical protein
VVSGGYSTNAPASLSKNARPVKPKPTTHTPSQPAHAHIAPDNTVPSAPPIKNTPTNSPFSLPRAAGFIRLIARRPSV